MSVTKIAVHNLSPHTTVESVSSLFSRFGTVRSVHLATDVMTGRCGGFGFVHIDELRMGKAISALQGHDLNGRALHVAYEHKAKPAN